MAMNKILKVKCPTCKKKVEYSTENPSRPFCSEKCKLIDLGQWFEEDYRFKSSDVFSEDEGYE